MLEELSQAAARSGLTPVQATIISAVVAALMSGIVSWAGIIVQAKVQRRRDILRMAVDCAVADHATGHQAAQTVLREEGHGLVVPPLASFTAYHLDYLDIAMNGDLDPESLTRLNRKWEQVNNFFQRTRTGP